MSKVGSLASLALIIASLGASLTTAHIASAKGHAKKDNARSVGAPNHGKLEGAALLHNSKTLHMRKDSHSWALPQLVHALKHAADAVAAKNHGSVMLVGDLSGRTGGPLVGHNSHQSGRDADVAFYAMNAKGKAVQLKGFVAFDGQGKAKNGTAVLFDDARNWAMVESLIKSDSQVRYLFITNQLKARLIAFATKKNVAKDIITRASAAMMSPEDADMHDDHVHVRIACPEASKEVCHEESVPRTKADGGEPYAPLSDAKDDSAK
jgi:penicillin-insensitive murein endopeptidase